MKPSTLLATTLAALAAGMPTDPSTYYCDKAYSEVKLLESTLPPNEHPERNWYATLMTGPKTHPEDYELDTSVRDSVRSAAAFNVVKDCS
ncbi:hypothetical protein ACJ72_01367 [Emergomyces africanus]|uniref:Uncharacterized protein n=1 Tax=Emergomyces africanus TaxID=1955775 RepID=A0A1B7P5D8_9EURO|nr:hypothetical protein ACJ72_01367 [Emergomyces africanus]